MRRLLGLALLLPLAALSRGADADRHNTLTAKEAADGWLLLFDGESTYGWRSPNGSKWTVAGGMLAPQAGKPGLLVTTAAFADYELSFEFRTKPNSGASVLVGCDRDGKRPEFVEDVALEYPGAGWCRARITILGHHVKSTEFKVGGRLLAESSAPSPNTPSPAGHLALSGNGVVFRNVKLKPLNTKPIFNGKDWGGWREHPGKKQTCFQRFSR